MYSFHLYALIVHGFIGKLYSKERDYLQVQREEREITGSCSGREKERKGGIPCACPSYTIQEREGKRDSVLVD
jgi:hypothetical protein